MSEPVLQVHNLKKHYQQVAAVDGISFSVNSGEIFGLLGPNGAGKTTTLECIEGLRVPTSGSVSVLGLDPLKDHGKLRRVLGVQLQTSALPETMLVKEAMTLICAWHGLKPRLDLLERFGLGEHLGRQFAKLSTGQKRRLELALALAGDPKLVILDEPTAGLDVQGRAQLHEAIRDLKRNGVSLILATHDMAEAEMLCDRIAILIRGKLATLGTPEQVTSAGHGKTRITIRTEQGSLLQQGDIGLATYVGETEGFAHWICTETAPAVMELLQTAMDAGDRVEDLRVERPSLEERFLEMVEGGGVQ